MTLKTNQPPIKRERLPKVVCEQSVTTSCILTLTTGVLTKPDTVEAGGHESWFRIIQNKHHILKHGWYITRQCSMEEFSKNLPSEKVQQMEQLFFREELWSKVNVYRL